VHLMCISFKMTFYPPGQRLMVIYHHPIVGLDKRWRLFSVGGENGACSSWIEGYAPVS
jgi:hypothetical protein